MARNIRIIGPLSPAAPKKKRVAAYARVSSGKDAMLHSLSAQVSYYSAYIQRQPGWEYAGVYADEALTGTKDDRPEFQRLLADCRAGQIDMVVTKSISRLARNTVTMLEAVRELRALNIDVFFEKENIHSLSGDGELMLTILASFAQEESRSVSENCKWRIRSRFRDGELVGLSYMYGYRICKGVIKVDLVEAAVVRRVFRDCIEGIGVETIAKRLNELGISQRRGGEWSGARVLHLLHNEKYTGNALLQKSYVADHLTKKERPNKGVLPMYFAEGTHPAIIDRGTFDRAQRRLEANRKSNNISKDAPARYPFSGIIQCDNCGQKFKRVVCHGRPYWQCTTYLRNGKAACHTKQIPEPILLSLAAQALGLSAFDEAAFNSQIQEMRIPAHDRVIFVFHDGHTAECVWQDNSRRDSWCEEKKQQARQRQLEYMEKENSQCNQTPQE
jgi:site-specific DNA recombinase